MDSFLVHALSESRTGEERQAATAFVMDLRGSEVAPHNTHDRWKRHFLVEMCDLRSMLIPVSPGRPWLVASTARALLDSECNILWGTERHGGVRRSRHDLPSLRHLCADAGCEKQQSDHTKRSNQSRLRGFQYTRITPARDLLALWEGSIYVRQVKAKGHRMSLAKKPGPSYWRKKSPTQQGHSMILTKHANDVNAADWWEKSPMQQCRPRK